MGVWTIFKLSPERSLVGCRWGVVARVWVECRGLSPLSRQGNACDRGRQGSIARSHGRAGRQKFSIFCLGCCKESRETLRIKKYSLETDVVATYLRPGYVVEE
jgi:hypothetical protein